MYIISRCLLGDNCKYNGGSNYNKFVIEFCRNRKYIAVCPEMAGGLPSPRLPAERRGERIMNRGGEDVTEMFFSGARREMENVIREAEKVGEKIEGAILKSNSPTCGSGTVYDGSFSGTLTKGDGCFAEMLKSRGIKVISEKEIENDKF